MPHEDRRIIFDYSEAYKAIYTLSVQQEIRKPPPGVIGAFTFDTEDDSKVRVRIDDPQNRKSTESEYTRDFLAAALMVYCRSCGVPLPKKARKSVEISGDSVILRIMI